MRLPRILLVVLAYLGTAGFSLLDYSPTKLKADLPAGAGVIVVSVGAPRTCFSRDMTLWVQPLTNRWSWNQTMAIPIDQLWTKSDYPDHHGTLSAKIVKAGEFEAYASFQGPGRTESTPRYVFSVAPGEIVYIGEYWLFDSCSNQTLGEFRDQSPRDTDLLRTLNPALAGAGMVTRLPTQMGVKRGV